MFTHIYYIFIIYIYIIFNIFIHIFLLLFFSGRFIESEQNKSW